MMTTTTFKPILSTCKAEIVDAAIQELGESHPLVAALEEMDAESVAYVARKVGDRFMDVLGDVYSEVLVREAGSYCEIETGL